MSTRLKHSKRKLIVDELREILKELKRLRFPRVSEERDNTRSEYLTKRVETAKQKLDDLKGLQRREKEVQKRRQEIYRDNKRRDSNLSGG